MKEIDKNLLNRFMTLAGDRLSGDWIVIGGTALMLKGRQYRVTNDIDVVGPKESTQSDLLILMEIAQNLGLPVEAINQAGAFFLYRIKNWQKKLILVHEGKTAKFYRPNAILYLLLKIQRLSETDLQDCLIYLEGETHCDLDIRLVMGEIRRLEKQNQNRGWVDRVKKLCEFMEKLK